MYLAKRFFSSSNKYEQTIQILNIHPECIWWKSQKYQIL
jgi:hypothetical protein